MKTQPPNFFLVSVRRDAARRKPLVGEFMANGNAATISSGPSWLARGERAYNDRMPIPLGALVPDLAFLRPDGGEAKLSAFRGKPLVLIFVRHLA